MPNLGEERHPGKILKSSSLGCDISMTGIAFPGDDFRNCCRCSSWPCTNVQLKFSTERQCWETVSPVANFRGHWQSIEWKGMQVHGLILSFTVDVEVATKIWMCRLDGMVCFSPFLRILWSFLYQHGGTFSSLSEGLCLLAIRPLVNSVDNI